VAAEEVMVAEAQLVMGELMVAEEVPADHRKEEQEGKMVTVVVVMAQVAAAEAEGEAGAAGVVVVVVVVEKAVASEVPGWGLVAVG
jgi:hypothetical protein